MSIGNNKFMRAASIVAVVAIAWLCLGGMASASDTYTATARTMSHRAEPLLSTINGPIAGCVFQTSNGHYLTAVSAGGRTTDVIHSDATRIGSWEKFTLIDSGDGSPNIHYGLQTVRGFYLTAVSGGGRTIDVIHSDATQVRAWEKFSFNSLGNGVYSIETINGHFLTAVSGGGRTTDVIHSDATQVRAWEKFRVSCGH